MAETTRLPASGYRFGRRRGDVVADALDLTYEAPERAAQRMAMTPGAVARALYRAHRPDLARRFDTLASRARYTHTYRRTAA